MTDAQRATDKAAKESDSILLEEIRAGISPRILIKIEKSGLLSISALRQLSEMDLLRKPGVGRILVKQLVPILIRTGVWNEKSTWAYQRRQEINLLLSTKRLKTLQRNLKLKEDSLSRWQSGLERCQNKIKSLKKEVEAQGLKVERLRMTRNGKEEHTA